MKKILILGGGLAGLAAGVALAEQGHKVTLLERRAFLGGRAYSFHDETAGEVIDNGQHLFMGCYHETFKFFRRLGTLDGLHFQERSRVDFLDAAIGQATFQCSSLPAPLHMLTGLLGLRGITLGDKLRTVFLGNALRVKNGAINEKFGQITVDQFLSNCNQSDLMKERFWNIFSIATLNEDPKVAVASLLVRVLQQAFGGSKADSTMVTAKVGLSELYTEQAKAFIEARGGSVQLRATVKQLLISAQVCKGVQLAGGEVLEADYYISSLPHFALLPLLPAELAQKPYFANWQLLKSSPIISFNLWFDRPVTDLQFAGLLGGKLQWLFNKDAISLRTREDRQHLCFVISAAHEFASMSKEQLLEMAMADVQKFLPSTNKAKLQKARIIKEQNATFSASIEAEKVRPDAQTPINNLLLAGDWTNTGLPATIEGAVLSGHRVADILNSH